MGTAMYTYDQLLSNRYLTAVRQVQFLAAVVIYTSLLLMPNPQLASAELSDYVLHAAGNAILMVSTWLASGGRYKSLGPLLFVVPFSVLVELGQGLTDNRTPEMSDVAANFVGAGIGYALCTLLGSILPKIFSEKN